MCRFCYLQEDPQNSQMDELFIETKCHFNWTSLQTVSFLGNVEQNFKTCERRNSSRALSRWLYGEPSESPGSDKPRGPLPRESGSRKTLWSPSQSERDADRCVSAVPAARRCHGNERQTLAWSLLVWTGEVRLNQGRSGPLAHGRDCSDILRRLFVN